MDFDDWSVEESYFRAVDSVWGPFTVDCFANSVNAKVSRFYSLFHQPGSLGVDSLAFDWGRENCWLCERKTLLTGRALSIPRSFLTEFPLRALKLFTTMFATKSIVKTAFIEPLKRYGTLKRRY